MSVVANITALVPLAEVYELKRETRYIIVVPRDTPMDALEGLATAELEISGVIIPVDDPEAFKVFDMGKLNG
jgi:hypothetical protein